MHKIRTAIVGFGFAGRDIHFPPLFHHPSYDVKIIMTRNPNTRDDIEKTYTDIRVVSTYQAILEDASIDLIILATPNDVHESYTKQALLYGKHVVCEKPFVETYAQSSALYELADANQKILRVYHNRRYDGDILTIKALLNTEDFGIVKSFSARFDRYIPEVSSNWRDHTEVMPGVFYDLAPHLVHDMIELFGKPHAVSMDLFFDRLNESADDHFEMVCYYDQMTAYLGASVLERHPKPRFEVIGTKKTYVKYGFDTPDLVHMKTDEPHQVPGLKSILIDENLNQKDIPLLMGAHYTFYDLLAHDILNKVKADTHKTLALQVIQVMEKALESYKSKQCVQI